MTAPCPLTSRAGGYLLRCIRPAGHTGDCLAAHIEKDT